MPQTKLGSLIESFMNILIGYWVALVSQLIIFPMFGIHIAFHGHQLSSQLHHTTLVHARLHRAAMRMAGESA